MGTPVERTCWVRFLPDGVSVSVPEGTTILDAARQANVYLNSVCGGDGICGKCRVILKSGRVDSPPTTLLTRDEVIQGNVLACMARVMTDTEVLVPEETRLEPGRILVDEDAERFGAIATVWAPAQFPHAPLVRKIYLEMTPPSMEDPLPDHERVYAAIRAKMDAGEMQTGFSVLQGLPAVLQAGNYRVTATVARRGAVSELVQVEAGDTSASAYGLAVDVGTTTIVVQLVDLNTGQTLDAEARYNSQMQYGEDYIARIMYAREHDALDLMQRTVVGDINRLINVLVTRNNIDLHDVVAAICSGNTAMVHFLMGLDPTRIQRAPYIPSANHIPPIRAAQVGIRINGRGLLYSLPSVGAYVGSDITAGVTAVRFDQLDQLSLYIDIGTNGEVVLGNRDWMVCCSASAGPAFEGSGVRHGMRASRGAIEKLAISPEGRCEFRTIGDLPPRGLCGSALLDALAEMLRVGILDRRGDLQPEAPGVRASRDGLEFLVVERERAGVDTDLVITQPDVRNLIRAKAAIFAAIRLLLESVGLDYDEIQQIFLAGGFGNYLNVRNAITIGMLPDIPPERIHFVGNGSITGARLALLSEEAMRVADNIGSQMTYLDLMQNTRFMEEFVAANFLPHTNVEQFPSVLKEIPVGTQPGGSPEV